MSTGTQRIAQVTDLPVRCSLSVPRLKFEEVPVTVESLDRKGAILLLEGPWTQELPLAPHERIELSLELPGENPFGRRSMQILGKVARESRDHLGRVWLVISFQSLAFRKEAGKGNGGENLVPEIRDGRGRAAVEERPMAAERTSRQETLTQKR